MAKIIWLPQAKKDIERLVNFLKIKNPHAAKQAIKAIRMGAKQLGTQPLSGRPMDDDTGRRELVLAFGGSGYVLRYMMDGETVVVIRVWHGKEKQI